MNLGIGIDIIDRVRVGKMYLRYGERFLKKILHHEEILTVNDWSIDLIISFLAKRFCIKEAISKAIGCGISNDYLSFHDLIIKKNELGEPYLMKNDVVLKNILLFKKDFLLRYNMDKLSVENINCLISISDEKNFSTSVAILELVV